MKKIGSVIIVLALVLMLAIPALANEAEAYSVWVGGVQVTAGNAQDVLGDGTVSYDVATGTLTLNSAEIVHEGGDGIHASNTDLTVCGNGSITAEVGICVKGGNVTLCGATLSIDASNIGVDTYADEQTGAGGSVTLCDDAKVFVDAKVLGIASDTNLTIRESSVYIVVADEKDAALYAYLGDITIIDSEITAQATCDGIYAYDGSVYIECTKVIPSSVGLDLKGTSVSVTAGKYAIFAFGELVLSEKLIITAPVDGKVQELAAEPKDCEPYTYQTIVDPEGNEVTAFTIEPLQYKISVCGLAHQMGIPVAAGESANAQYCQLFGVTDMSEIFDTEREGYTFGGWYTDEACTDGNEFSFDMPITENITIYAKWVAVSDTPPTGDSSPLAAMLALLLCSGGAILMTVTYKKRAAQ